MRPVRISLAGVVSALAVLLVAGVCARLGVWQLNRLNERVARNAGIEERLSMPDVALPPFDDDTAGLSYRHVELRGEFDTSRSIIFAPRAYRGSPGVHVITPLRLESGEGVVLVDRGWLFSPDASTVDLSSVEVTGPVHLRGLLLPFPEARRSAEATPSRDAIVVDGEGSSGEAGFRRLWYRPDGEAIRKQFPYPVSTMYVQALPDSSAPPFPVRQPLPELDDGPHLGYALQWFTFGLIAIIGWIVVLIRGVGLSRRRER